MPNFFKLSIKGAIIISNDRESIKNSILTTSLLTGLISLPLVTLYPDSSKIFLASNKLFLPKPLLSDIGNLKGFEFLLLKENSELSK